MTTRAEDRQELIDAFRHLGAREGYHVNIPFDGRNMVVGLEDAEGRATIVVELDGSRLELTPYAAENLAAALAWVPGAAPLPDGPTPAPRREAGTVTLDGITYDRIPAGSGVGWDNTESCHECGVVPGELHLLGCDVEVCPDCMGQLAVCGRGNLR